MHHSKFHEQKIYSGISYAWEKIHNKDNEFINNVINATKDTNTLIAIGYSFPEDNWEYDCEIINAMSNLTDIYIQNPDATKIKDKISKILPEKKIHEIKDCKQFMTINN